MIKEKDLNSLYYEFVGSINEIVFGYMEDKGIDEPWDLMDDIQSYFDGRLLHVFDELKKKINIK